MSGGSAKRKMETGTSHGKAPSNESDAKGREESPPRVKSHRSGNKKKKIKKVVYYETDSSSPSTSGSNAASVTSKRHERKKFSKIPLRYPCISKRAPLLSIPLGKPPFFYGEDYCMWSDKMRHHLTSLHASIWDIVEFGAQVPTVGDEGYDSDECDTPVSPRVSLKKPNQEPLLPVNQSKHEHQNNLSDKEFTKNMFKSVMIKTIESLKR
jgi:hypothetical protein